MDMKKIEDFSTTQDAALCRKAIEARVEGGQQFQTPAPFIRHQTSAPLALTAKTIS